MKINFFARKLLSRLRKSFQVIVFPTNVYDHYKYEFHSISFAQEGEDIILDNIFERKINGFYIDVGAHHPQRLSNTYYFYLKGWKGINIDAMPYSMRKFNELRPNDINLEIPISKLSSSLTYYKFDESALNSFSCDLSKQRHLQTTYKIIEEIQLKTKTLAEVLDEHLPKDQKIDFLSVDVEGLDYEVLQSNNWDKYKPQVILVEDLEMENVTTIDNSKIYIFLVSRGYILIAMTIRTLIFKLKSVE